MTAVVHSFPFLGSVRSPARNQMSASAIEMEEFSPSAVVELNTTIQSILERADIVLDLLQSDRDVVRRMGIESLCVELIVILEGDKFSRVASAVQNAAANGESLLLTRDGLTRVRRLEAILAEAERAIGRSASGRRSMGAIGQSSGDSGQMSGVLMGSMIVLGTVVVTVIGALVVSYVISRSKR